MKLTKITECGLMILPALAVADKPLKINELVARTGVLPTYAAVVLPRLRQAGILKAARGRHGGYSLAIEPQAISILVVIEILEGESFLVASHRPAHLRQMGQSLATAVRQVPVTLADLVETYTKAS